jgi:hypothetical protein
MENKIVTILGKRYLATNVGVSKDLLGLQVSRWELNRISVSKSKAYLSERKDGSWFFSDGVRKLRLDNPMKI